MAKYLLTCGCGRTLAVETSQAGESLQCECSATVAVPTLRQLRELPPAIAENAPSESQHPSWGVAQGVASVCLIAASLFLAIAGYVWVNEPTLPQFNAVANTQFVAQRIDQLTPKEAWQAWHRYQTLAANGFAVFEHPRAAEIRESIGARRLLEGTLAAVAAISLAIAAVVVFAKRR